jgi:cell division protein FtsZ
VNEAAAFISDKVDEEANIIWGAVTDESMGDAVSLTIIATGVSSRKGGRPGGASELPSAAVIRQARKPAAAAAAPAAPAAAAAEPPAGGDARSGSPNPFMSGLGRQGRQAGGAGGSTKAAPSRPAAGGSGSDAQKAGSSNYGGGIEVPAFLRNLHKPRK